jgi:hypothetical protein
MTNTRRAVTAVCEKFALPRIEIDTAIRSEGDGIEAIEEIAARCSQSQRQYSRN